MKADFSSLLIQVRANRRLRMGLWAVLAILWLAAILDARDRVPQAADALRVEARKLARAEALVGQTDWMQRAQQARALRVEEESRLWQAASAGLAQASFQDWLGQTLLTAGATRPAVTVAAVEGDAAGPAKMPDDLWAMRAKAEFDFDPKALDALLTKLAQHEKPTVVESLLIRREPVPRVELVLVAHFLKPGDVKAEAPAAPGGGSGSAKL